MPFHFPLEAVFHLRKSVEHQQELRLRAANQQVSRVRHHLDELDARLRQREIHSSRGLASGTTAAELHFTIAAEKSLQARRLDLSRELERVKILRDQQQRIFQQARRERETLEALRDQQLREYKRLAARREQRSLDDLFLLRQAYLRRG